MTSQGRCRVISPIIIDSGASLSILPMNRSIPPGALDRDDTVVVRGFDGSTTRTAGRATSTLHLVSKIPGTYTKPLVVAHQVLASMEQPSNILALQTLLDHGMEFTGDDDGVSLLDANGVAVAIIMLKGKVPAVSAVVCDS